MLVKQSHLFFNTTKQILPEKHMKPARGPQTEFFSNSCSGIPGLANAAELGKSRQV